MLLLQIIVAESFAKACGQMLRQNCRNHEAYPLDFSNFLSGKDLVSCQSGKVDLSRILMLTSLADDDCSELHES